MNLTSKSGVFGGSGAFAFLMLDVGDGAWLLTEALGLAGGGARVEGLAEPLMAGLEGTRAEGLGPVLAGLSLKVSVELLICF